MLPLTLVDGEFSSHVQLVTLRAASSAGAVGARGGAFHLVGQDSAGNVVTSDVKQIDGILFDDPTTDGADNVVLWMHNPQSQLDLGIPDNSPACTVFLFAGFSMPNQPVTLQMTKRTGEIVQLEIVGGTWKTQDIGSLFFSRLLVVVDEVGKVHVPDSPIDASWLSAVEETQISVETAPDGRPASVSYTIRFKALSTLVTRTYARDEFMTLGSADSADPMRIMVWPNIDTESWRFFCVDLGRKMMSDWDNTHWSIHTTVRHGDADGAGDERAQMCRNDTMLPYRVFPCRSVRGRGTTSSPANLTELQGRVTRREVSQDRPELLQLERREQGAGGVFKLLEHKTPTRLKSEHLTIGVDIGTSNSCVSVRSADDKTASFDLDMTRSGAAFSLQPGDSLVFVRVGGGQGRLTTVEPWLPGMEGPAFQAEIGRQPQALTQLPSLVLLLKTDGTTADSIDPNVALDLLPVRDVLVPPPDYLKSFAGPQHHVTGTYDTLKWLSRSREPSRSYVFLQKYLESLFLFVAAKLRHKSIRAHLSYPLAFSADDLRKLENAAKEAARFTSSVTGVEIDPKLYADEGRCIVSAHVRSGNLPQNAIPISVVCDIGGGSIDIAIVTYHPEQRQQRVGDEPPSLVFLAADSVRFGANLVFERLFKELGPARAPKAKERPDGGEVYAREMFKQALRQDGYAKILDALPSHRKFSAQVVGMYFELVREYLARSIAAAVRNPYLLGGAINRFYPSAGAAPSAAVGPWGAGSGISPITPEMLVTVPATDTLPGGPIRWMQNRDIAVDLLLTGNGWKSFEVFGQGALQATSQPMSAFIQALQARVVDLVKAPIPGESHTVVDAFSATRAIRAAASVGLRRPSTREMVLKEALADSILSYTIMAGLGEADGNELGDRLSACNGFTEQEVSPGGFWGSASEDKFVPWYAMVGPKRGLSWRGNIYEAIAPPQGTMEVRAAVVPLAGGRLTPAPSNEIKRLGMEFGLSLDFGDLYQQHAAEVNQQLIPAAGDSRVRSLLSVIFERVLARRLFNPEW